MTREELNALIEERAKLWDDAKKFNKSISAEKRDMSPEEDTKWDAMNADLDSQTKTIDRETRILEQDQLLSQKRADHQTDLELRGEPVRNGAQGGKVQGRSDVELRAFHGWCLHGMGREDKITPEHRAAVVSSGNKFGSDTFDFNLFSDYRQVRSLGNRELRAGMEAGGAGVGLEWVPEGFVSELERAMLAFGGMRQAARVWRTESGNDIKWPEMTDTANVGAILSEATTIGASVDPTSSAVTFEAWKYSSKPILVSSEFMEDNDVNFSQIVAEMLGERIARILNTHLTTGDASSKPNGVVTASTSGTSTAAAATDTQKTDAIFDLYHSVDPAYRNGAIFMMHDLQVKMFRKIKDSTEHPIWQPGLAIGTPDRLIGVPIVINQDMDSTFVSTDKVLLYGDFSKYIIRDVKSIRIKRLVERYADLDQEAFIAFSRHDGDMVDAGAVPIKHWNVTA